MIMLERERGREGDREREKDGVSERERKRERASLGERERCRIFPELFLFLKGMTGALSPFSYLVEIYLSECHK